MKVEGFTYMRNILLVFAVFIILLCTGCKTQYGENWQKISLRGSTIMMPGKAQKTQDGNSTKFKLDQNSELYIASFDLMVTPSPEIVNQALDTVRNSFIMGMSGTMLNERSISLGGFPGREFNIESSKYGKTSKHRIYLAKSILYQIGVAWETGKSISSDAEKYLDSFEIQSN
jgi:hypothetical protein